MKGTRPYNGPRAIFAVLLCFLAENLRAYPSSSTIAILWVDSPFKTTELQKRQAEHALIKELENNQGRRVMRQSNHYSLPVEVFKNVQGALELQELSQELWNLTQKPEFDPTQDLKEKGQKIFERQQKILSRLSRGVFGPEIQEAKLSQAAWELLWGKKEKCFKLIREAAELHPQGEIAWTKEVASPLGHVFEAMLVQGQNQVQSLDCFVYRSGEKDLVESKVWINGFKMKKDFQGIRRGRYLINKVFSPRKEIFEDLLNCKSGEVRWEELRWAQIKMGLRIEQWLATVTGDAEEMVLLFPRRNEIEKYWYAKRRGLKLLNSEKVDLGVSLPLLRDNIEKTQEGSLQKIQDVSPGSRLSLHWVAVGFVAALGIAYGLKPSIEPTTIPVILKRE